MGAGQEQLERFDRWRQALADATRPLVPDGTRIVDGHVHAGVDAGSGLEMTIDAIEHQLDQAGAEGAVLIPLNASDGYHRTNLRLAERARGSDGRFRSLYRVGSGSRDLAARVREGLDAGASGLKLHPVSDGVDPLDPAMQPALEVAQERRAMVLVHTGVDVEHAALDTVEAARRYPGVQFVIGHVAAESLELVAERIVDLDNVHICTAWWGPIDIALAMSWSHPSRFIFGSDPPYGAIPLGMATTARVARCVGYGDDDVAGVLGGNLERLLRGRSLPKERGKEGPRDDGAGFLLDTIPMPFRRCYLALISAGANVAGGGKSATYAMLAKAALGSSLVPDELLPLVEELRELIDLARDLDAAGETVPAYVAYAGAMVIALTGPVLSATPATGRNGGRARRPRLLASSITPT